MGNVRLGRHAYGYTLARVPSTGDWDSLLVQTDWDYPGTASTFGWTISDVIGAPGHSSCYHDGTDGTVDCTACGRTASEFIADARRFLDAHIGDEAADPGYWA